MRRKHQDLMVWQQAMELVRLVYQITTSFPKHELFGLVGQMRRAAISVPANIAEGAGRTSKTEFLHFLSIARGSMNELDTYIILAKDLGYLNDIAEMAELSSRVFGLLGGLINSERKASAR